MKASSLFTCAVSDRIAAFVVANRASLDAHVARLRMEPKYHPGGAGDLAMRVRWDLFWKTCGQDFRDDHAQEMKALTDAHIDTVLRQAMSRAGLPEFSTM